MKEALENKPVFDYIPNIIRSSEVLSIEADQDLRQQILGLMTPKEVLEEEEFSLPEAIDPRKYSNFNSLLERREQIRCLRLLPVKTNDEYIRYHQQDRNQLIKMIRDYLGDSPQALAQNLFPYNLPEDVGQYIIWVNNHKVNNCEVVDFIAKIMRLFRLSPDEVILFERPEKTRSKLVKGTFAELRHIHFWIKS